MKIKHLFIFLALLFPLMGCPSFINSEFFQEEDFAEPAWLGGYEGLLTIRFIGNADNTFEEKFENVGVSIVSAGALDNEWHSNLTFLPFPMDAEGNKTTTNLEIEQISGKALSGKLYSNEYSTRAIWDGKEYRISKLTGNYQQLGDQDLERLFLTIIIEDPKIAIEYDGRRPLTNPDAGSDADD